MTTEEPIEPVYVMLGYDVVKQQVLVLGTCRDRQQAEQLALERMRLERQDEDAPRYIVNVMDLSDESVGGVLNWLQACNVPDYRLVAMGLGIAILDYLRN